MGFPSESETVTSRVYFLKRVPLSGFQLKSQVSDCMLTKLPLPDPAENPYPSLVLTFLSLVSLMTEPFTMKSTYEVYVAQSSVTVKASVT